MQRMLVAALAMAVVACRSDDGPDGETRTQRGDTTVVVTRGPGAWGPVREADEVFRSDDDDPETQLGEVFYPPVPTPAGGVVLLDTKDLRGVQLKEFGADGRFVRTIGRGGDGPGEYGQLGRIAYTVAGDGSVLVRDGRVKVIRYDTAGRFVSEYQHGFSSTFEMYPAADGELWLRGPFAPRVRGEPEVLPPLLRLAADGRVLDSIVAPRAWVSAADRASGAFQLITALKIMLNSPWFCHR
jgi:hypothetical protein